ncbi:MAG: formylmethanofuran dehydrogenase subunit A, partial [Planctomycetota bacterium]
MLTRITGGHVLDPANGVNRVQDLFIRDDRVVASPGAAGDGPSAGMDAASLTIDARDCVIMAGGIDIHSHIGGGKATLARLLTSDVNQDQPGKEAFLPTASRTAQRYLDMGYTAAFEPAVLPCNARAAHAEMRDVAGLDTGGYCLLGNDDVLLSMIADGIDQSVINDYVAWMVRATQAIAVKVVNPGGISAFKFETREFDVDTPHPKYGVTPAQLIRTLCEATQAIGLTHPLHVHCSNLGVPGNIRSTLKTIEAAQGLPIHLTHVQFHCYGANGVLGMSSASEQLVAALDRHPNVTIDVGQVMFGQTVTISADTMHQHANFRLADPKKSILVDVECEAGCGVVPFRYRHRQYVHSLQWAIGLELFLMVDDPSRVFLTTDHPNGAPFTAYPHLIRLLCDRSFRATALAEIHRDAAAASQLGGLDREYSLEQIAVMTRSAPARILGLRNLGHLGPGAVADLVVYRNQADRQRMFERPEWVLRRGNVVRRPTAEFD